jgi:hypothetical protein
MLALLAALKQITNAHIKLRLVLEIAGSELARVEQREELRVPGQCRLGRRFAVTSSD